MPCPSLPSKLVALAPLFEAAARCSSRWRQARPYPPWHRRGPPCKERRLLGTIATLIQPDRRGLVGSQAGVSSDASMF